MDALFLYKNDVHLLTVALMPSAAFSLSIDWIGNARKKIWFDLARADHFGTHRWEPLRLIVGDKISFVTGEGDKIDEPIHSFTPKQLDDLQKNKPMMKPRKRARPPCRDIGELSCQIRSKDAFSFQLKTENLLLITVAWLGDRNGTCIMHVGVDGSSNSKRIPKIRFGDEVTFVSTVQGSARRKP